MREEEFNIDTFRKNLGFDDYIQPYDYERYKRFNPKLTQIMYEHLRSNNAEWKILCGVPVKIQWTNEYLEEVWHLKCGEGYKSGLVDKNRHNPEFLSKLDW